MTTTERKTRVDLARNAPAVYKAMIALDAAARQGLEPELVELVLTRCSQINHCAWCIDMHTAGARKIGVSEQKLFLLNAWEEAQGLYTEKERAAFALAEAITVLTDGFVPDSVYEGAQEYFDETELAQLISLVLTINAWNRIAVSTRMSPQAR
ncbi:carboxymuconolactone decarboxylase family protein [Rhodococcus marinonascens]|uniref:carboxymuconolactone decarboxylase family protein n=1 Tax=Rhodococcus marinonascens TaxID=38311 RepID=UPI000932B8FE|nr:carboxymuconolactone decarboxylase family protein [Rhodococcus marinonascens]